ncbi:Methyltransferase domain protein [Crateriforma conspicua]|uniref:Methyltransferase domain protein n=2 Tax=Crateriforma conspicua TaxID=2527996 RepID=A0A5C5XSI6_9PLAN|nr:Methyltransferase domain protein [Crateriforma conspicua]
MRFASSQTAMRLASGGIVHHWIRGTKFIVYPGESGLTQNIYCGLHEYADMLFLLHTLRSGDLFVDVGANVGSYTLLASGVVGAKSISFEPVPETFQRLTDNALINRLGDRVALHQCGVGAENDEMVFTSDQNCTNHVLAENEERKANDVVVPVRRADEVLNGMSPVMIKIDVEGYETQALRGATKTLGNPTLRAVIMELNGSGERYGFDESAIIRMMQDLGFSTSTYDPFNRVLVPLEGKCLTSGNTLFVRDFEFLQERLASADPIEVNRLSI